MKPKILVLALFGFVFTLGQLSAQTTFTFPTIDSPPIVQDGLDKYRTDGSKAALDLWLAGSSAFGMIPSKLQALLSALDIANGRMLRFEHIGTINLSPSVRVSWYTLCYAKGVAFAEFTSFQGKSSWIITNIRISSDYRDVLPAYQFPLH